VHNTAMIAVGQTWCGRTRVSESHVSRRCQRCPISLHWKCLFTMLW